MNKNAKILYLMAGIPASGKSTCALQIAQDTGAVYVSRDEIRFAVLKDGEEYFSHEDEVYDEFVAAIQAALDGGNSCIADATHLSMFPRYKLLDRLNLTDVKVILVMMGTSLEECLRRNALRTGRARVPDSVIRNMWVSYKAPIGMETEKYYKIITVKDGEYHE